MKKLILDTIYETVGDLNKGGVMKGSMLRGFDALCLPPAKEYTPAQIKRISR